MSQILILLQNKDFLAVDKPAGVSVHNEDEAGNLLSLLGAQLKVAKLFPVHRLDKETSGVQVLALNAAAAKTLADEFQKKTVEKIYLGILRGKPFPAEGIWAKPLTDKSEGRKNPQGVAADRVPCETRYRILQESAYFALCEFALITGRQHQIRKHAALDGHPLIGDSRYGDLKYNQKMAVFYKTDRMFLHCQRLEILGENIEAQVPNIFSTLFLST